MEKPNYVLKTNEGVFVPKNENPLLGTIKIAVWIIVLAIIVSSIFFSDNMFSKISWLGRILLIAIAIGVSFIGGYKSSSSPFEIQFYDDYLIIYREKVYRSKNVFTREYDKFFYKDIKKCEYRTITEKFCIQGIDEGIRYKYNRDGSLADKPILHKVCENICYFYTTEAPEVNFISEIESHSPIKVSISEES